MPSLFTLIRGPFGAIFLMAGLNHFFGWFPLPFMAEPAQVFMQHLKQAPYFMDAVALTQIVGGGLCFLGLFVPLGALILAPVVVQIFLFHFFLDPGNLWIAATIGVLQILIFIRYWTRFLPFVSPW